MKIVPLSNFLINNTGTKAPTCKIFPPSSLLGFASTEVLGSLGKLGIILIYSFRLKIALSFVGLWLIVMSGTKLSRETVNKSCRTLAVDIFCKEARQTKKCMQVAIG
jgi:hypothetical protein